MKIKVSSSVLHFLPKAKAIWKLNEWLGVDDPDQDVLFFGLFHDRDYEVFHNVKGQKSVFWCGGDILRLKEDYERQRVIRISPGTKHYCENEQEAEKLRSIGIEPEVIPSFLGDIGAYPISFKPPKPGERWKVWMCGHPKREVEYGFDQARELAKMFSDVEFHFYGVDKDYEGKVRVSSDDLPNVFYHGLVPEKQLDEEIKKYHAGMRCNEHDGVSEVVIKSALLGQYTISRIPYEGVWHYQTFEELKQLVEKLKQQTEPNLQAREIWLKKINCFPWVKK